MTAYKHTNRLSLEKSPYLLQHAHNPVDWYPWGEEAFSKARTEDRPIFLSIGYSTCHWCHVMERESFEDQDVADVLNKYFICIKVDREERPDVDSIYMDICQALTGSGGWPLTIIMTPDKKPFFAGTYFPKTGTYGSPGLMELAEKLGELWNNNKYELMQSGAGIVNSMKHDEAGKKADIDMGAADEAFEIFKSIYDSQYGGWGSAPKFPTPHNITFLLRYCNANGKDEATQMALSTLRSMYRGGIFDHIGFGFSRYSVDRKWLVPHFEKMLYDNAMLASAYTEGFQSTGNNLYREVAEKIIVYILRDMTSPEGGFYSAEDADSEGEEGKFYLWTADEVESVLGREDGKLFCSIYDITDEGNFEGKNIPNLIGTILSDDDKDTKHRLDLMRKELFEYRKKRTHPFLDDKILTSWNGLMIGALSYAGRVFDNKDYVKAAEADAMFILGKLVREDGRLFARYRDGEAAFPGYLDDYAFFIYGLIELYQASFKLSYLDKAVELTERMLNLFWDVKNDGFFIYGNDSEELILRPKDVYDGALPSGNSVAAMDLLKLSRVTGDSKYEAFADKIFHAFGADVRRSPISYSYLLNALMYRNVPGMEIVIAGDLGDNETVKMLDEYNRRYIPYSSIVLNDEDEKLNRIAPSAAEKKMTGNRTTAYVCRDFACMKPADSTEQFKKLIDNK